MLFIMEFWDTYWGDVEKVSYSEFLGVLCHRHSLTKYDIPWLRGSSLTTSKLDEEKFNKVLGWDGGIYVRVCEGADQEFMYKNYFVWTAKKIPLNEETIKLFRSSSIPVRMKAMIFVLMLILVVAASTFAIIGVYNSNYSGSGRGMGILIGLGVDIFFLIIPTFFIKRHEAKKIKEAKMRLLSNNV